MIPRKLVMEGLYSYRRRTEIDFDRLTAARLFGIFGPVGSGKSTILEAIGLAVYGDTTRLNSRSDNRNYNILNLRSDRLWIDYRFLNHDGAEYRFTVETKRNRNNYEQVAPLQRSAYRLRSNGLGGRDGDGDSDDTGAGTGGGEWEPLESASGEDIVGLSYENFRRTVIIPQGRFQEFLQLGVRDRTDMLQELFGLDRFDLYRPARNLKDAAAKELTGVEAALGEISPDLDERRSEVETELKKARAERASLLKRRETAEAWRNKLTAVVEVIREQEEITAEQKRLDEETPRITALRQRQTLLETVRDRLAAPFNDLTRARHAEEEASKRLEEVNRDLTPASAARKEIDKRLATLEEQEQQRPETEARRDALRLAATYHENRLAFQQKQEQLKTEQTRREAAQSELDEYNAKEAKLQSRIETAQSAIPPVEVLTAAEEFRRLTTEITALNDALTDHRNRLQDIRQILVATGAVSETLTLSAELPDAATALKDILATRRRHRDLEVHLARLAGELQEGEPCPLCGAVHHPAPAAAVAPAAAPAPATPDSPEDALHDELVQIIAIHRDSTTRISALQKQLNHLSETHTAKDLAGADLAGPDLAAIAADLPTIQERNRALEDDRRALNTLQQRRNTLHTQVTEIATRTAAIQGSLEETERRLTADASALPDDLRTNDPQTGNPQPLRAEADAIDTALTQLSRDLKRARHEQDEARTRETRLLSTLEERKQSAQRATEETARAETALSEALAAVPAPIAPENLPALIQETQELPDITKTILHHDQARTVVESRARQLDQRARDATPPDLDEPVHTALTRAETTVAEIQEELHQLDHRTGSLQRETDEITRQTTRRTELQTRQTHLSGRIENLNTLVKLFQGSKFVSYVASVFLEQLVALANDRFRRLTRNRLELALRGDHDFEVVDYLNGGRRRSVKTLSGGQTFQAALCLALALVDSIDHRAGTDMPGFFFLDEGFGSLDEESLRDVFATLTDLRRENRIVGVISHVESMQEEMETYLRISIDQEEGSVISTGVADPTDPTGAHIT